MNAFRRNRFRTAVMLLLVMVFSMVGMPAFAACAAAPAIGAPAGAAPQPTASACHDVREKPCCCGPSKTANAELPTLGSEPCGCELRAPQPEAPAEPKPLRTVSAAAFAVPPSAFTLTAPAAVSLPLLPADAGDPRDTCRASAPSRAPPASER